MGTLTLTVQSLLLLDPVLTVVVVAGTITLLPEECLARKLHHTVRPTRTRFARRPQEGYGEMP